VKVFFGEDPNGNNNEHQIANGAGTFTFSPDVKQLLVARFDHKLFVFDARTWKLVRAMHLTADPGNLPYSPHGDAVVAAVIDCVLGVVTSMIVYNSRLTSGGKQYIMVSVQHLVLVFVFDTSARYSS